MKYGIKQHRQLNMTRLLQIVFTLTLGLVLIFLVADLVMGTPADISDRAATEGWADDSTMYSAEKMKSRLWTLVYAIPAIILLTATIKSIRQKNERLFYWTFLIGLTFFQLIPVAGLLSNKAKDSPFIVITMFSFFLIFMGGQVFSIFRIIKSSYKLCNL